MIFNIMPVKYITIVIAIGTKRRIFWGVVT